VLAHVQLVRNDLIFRTLAVHNRGNNLTLPTRQRTKSPSMGIGSP
jgi:hypothetical protein